VNAELDYDHGALHELLEDAHESALRDPFSMRRYTRPQLEFLATTAAVAIYRTGNQAGKTFALIDDAIGVATGRHMFRPTPAPPVTLMFVSVSDDQMRQPDGLMTKIYSALPRDDVDWDHTGWDPARGFTGRPARIVFKNGSVIGFGTFKQDPQRFAGASVYGVYMDEPPPERKFAELRARIFARRGFIRISFTPTPDAPPLAYLRKKVETGEVTEVHCVTTEENLWPVGALAPMHTQAEIDEFISAYPEYEQAMRREGAWEPLVTGRVLTNFSDGNVRPFGRSEFAGAEAFLLIGIDHGALAGKQVAVLVVIKGRETSRPRVWIVDEAVADDATTPEDDARHILEMLDRNDLSVAHVDRWTGDRSLETKREYGKKSNEDLRREIALALGRPVEKVPVIETPRKKAGSVNYGIRLINALLGRYDEKRDGERVPHFSIHPRCTRVIAAYRGWAGDKKDPLKDAFDASRYPIEAAVSTLAFPSVIAQRS
jgi:phage terminase large subunit-like protein